ncbi:MAG: Denitrification system component NirT [Betaproteobacteria bacterium]|nr:MAG: Denitrification system component NirT [Betaproteobacteria bacterium]
MQSEGGGRLARGWKWLRSPSQRVGAGSLLAIGGVLGIIFWGGFNTFMEYTNTLEFCVSCHEMKHNVYEEYKKTVHYTNRSGVRVICSDCHVPREWTAKLIRKVKATNELYHKLVGTIDTPEKFNAKREELAKRVWASMVASDSHECRNCHSYQAMDFHKQTTRAREKMEEAMNKGVTCIECHKGVAHTLPPRDD